MDGKGNKKKKKICAQFCCPTCIRGSKQKPALKLCSNCGFACQSCRDQFHSQDLWLCDTCKIEQCPKCASVFPCGCSKDGSDDEFEGSDEDDDEEEDYGEEDSE